MIQHECSECDWDVRVTEREPQLKLQGKHALVRRSWTATAFEHALSQGFLPNY